MTFNERNLLTTGINFVNGYRYGGPHYIIESNSDDAQWFDFSEDGVLIAKMTDTGFIVERTNRDPLVYEGKIEDIKVFRDEYVLEIRPITNTTPVINGNPP